jgi:hypothetical protein
MCDEYESKVGSMSLGWVLSKTTKWCFLSIEEDNL